MIAQQRQRPVVPVKPGNQTRHADLVEGQMPLDQEQAAVAIVVQPDGVSVGLDHRGQPRQAQFGNVARRMRDVHVLRQGMQQFDLFVGAFQLLGDTDPVGGLSRCGDAPLQFHRGQRQVAAQNIRIAGRQIRQVAVESGLRPALLGRCENDF